jgi:hypothetical protein
MNLQSDPPIQRGKGVSNSLQDRGFVGEPGGARTRDHRIKSAMLYQLSYRPKLPDFSM